MTTNEKAEKAPPKSPYDTEDALSAALAAILAELDRTYAGWNRTAIQLAKANAELDLMRSSRDGWRHAYAATVDKLLDREHELIQLDRPFWRRLFGRRWFR